MRFIAVEEPPVGNVTSTRFAAEAATMYDASVTTSRKAGREPGAGWLLLIHQLPPTPAYLRAKIGRHLARVGAIAVKNSVYVLPATEQAREDLDWVYREIVSGGGEAWVCTADFVRGLDDAALRRMFQATRDVDYASLAEDARGVRRDLPRRGHVADSRRAELEGHVARLQRRLSEIAAIDFFEAPGRLPVEGVIADIAARLATGGEDTPVATRSLTIDEAKGRTWVTRKNVHVDRIASAWLIRRVVDAEARFRFVAGKEHTPEPGELRFDMFEAEFTHEGDRCTFEVLLLRFGIRDSGLAAIAEIVHDIDLKDDKFGRPERSGVERMIQGIVATVPDDLERIERAGVLLDGLRASLAR